MNRMYAPLLPFVVSALLLGGPAQDSRPAPLVFTHVTVVDANDELPKPDMTVVVTGDRITALGKTGKVTVPKDAQVVDATGKYLIPGLWDMHVHLHGKEVLFPLFIANGVTGVRQMGGGPHQQIDQWRKQITNQTLIGPRIVAAGQIVTGPKPAFPGALAVANVTEGRAAVTSLRQRGVDFLKVYSLLPRNAYFAIADEAKKQDLPFAGHIPASVSAAEVSDAGQRSIEHLSGSAVLLACSTRETELRQEAVEAIVESDYSLSVITHYLLFGRFNQLLDTYSDKKAAALFARFAKNGTRQVPTLTGRRARAFERESHFINDPRLKYIPPSLKEEWENSYTKDFTAKEFADVRRLYQKQLDIVGAMRRAQVDIMAGTDAGNPNCYPGFSLHDELALLVKAGLTPIEALQSATRSPAEFLGRMESFGTVEEGKIADLVLLDANPLEEISNTQKIAAVVLGGKIIFKTSLQTMLAQVEAAVSRR